MANKPTPADFSPTVPDFPVIGQYQPIYGKFDLTTYIQGASDYEIMSFLVQCYNATLKGYSDVTQLSKDTVTAYNQLQTWVNTWFNELDVQQEINNKLQAMYEAGTLANAIAQSNTIPPAVAQYLNSTEGTQNLSNVTAQKIEAMAESGALGTVINNTGSVQSTTTNWLRQNVTPTGSAVMVDKSLSVEGAAADSKVTGDGFANFGINVKDAVANKLDLSLMIKDNTALFIPKGYTYVGDLTITSKNVLIYGGGTIRGSLILDTPLDSDGNQPDSNITIDGITFIPDTQFYAIRLKKCRNFIIRNCIFDPSNGVCIYFNETSEYGQQCNRGLIVNNKFAGNYSLNLSENSANYFGVGDITFSDNICSNKVGNVVLKGIDGYKDNNNTYFMTSYTNKSPEKSHNISIDKGIWISITNSTLFEAGLAGIHIEKMCQNVIIANNIIGWCGQRAPTSAISIGEHDASGGLYNLTTICNNTIIFPTLHGITVATLTGRISINGNMIIGCGNRTYYYGTIDLSTLKHYAINYPLVNEGMYCTAFNNNACGDKYNLSPRISQSNNV